MRIQATFTAKHFSESKAVVLICRETGDRYSFSELHPFDPTPIFRNGSLVAYRRGKARILALIESDARWAIRDDLAKQRSALRGKRSTVWA
jgi:hypothetical protein